MQPVTQDEKILPACLQVFNTSSLGYPADAQQQPNSSHIHHSEFTASVNWRIIQCHSCSNTATVSVSVSLNAAVAARCQYYVASVTDELMSKENCWNDSEGKTKPKYRWTSISVVYHCPEKIWKIKANGS